jgi:pilus assembly protein Flp/PilA
MNDQRLSVEHGTAPSLVLRLLTEEDGVTAIEYGLMAALIVVTIIGALTATGNSLELMFTFWSGVVVAAL